MEENNIDINTLKKLLYDESFRGMDEFSYYDEGKNIILQNPCRINAAVLSEALGDKGNFISETMKIDGSITLTDKCTVHGIIEGNVAAENCNISVRGKIYGDINGGSIELRNAKVRGHVNVSKEFNSEGSTVLVGNINASSVSIDANSQENSTAENGDVPVNGAVSGNINAASVKLNNAKVKGNVNVSDAFTSIGNTVLVGDVTASSAVIDGKIKGKVSADHVRLNSSALIIGSIVTGQSSDCTDADSEELESEELFDF